MLRSESYCYLSAIWLAPRSRLLLLFYHIEHREVIMQVYVCICY